ncbi:TPA: hypothetical protein N0F65_003185 [Lagenidium giganteum]|uniref:RING-type domain-containing protein n=1 Tax=Lagenidium giganteum TaxID=4803 RepID=A0AAV2ZC82_9STRA|nr:TPA: hypothetical protein N0F65_003185 [Lagenidium giganteum]
MDLPSPRNASTRAPPPPPWIVQQLLLLVSGRRYLLLTVAAALVAMASTGLNVSQSHGAPLLNATVSSSNDTMPAAIVNAAVIATVANAANATDTVETNALAVAAGLDGPLTWRSFAAEVLSSRLSALIMTHCYLVLLYHIFLGVARVTFGVIRATEIMQTKEIIIHFLLIRFLLLASTMGPIQDKVDVVTLLVWLSAVAFLRGLLALCKARFEHLVTRPMVRSNDLNRLAITLVVAVVVDFVVASACAALLVDVSSDVASFAWFEAVLLLIKALQLGVKVLFHVIDVNTCSEGWSFRLFGHAFSSDQSELYVLIMQMALSAWYLVQLVVYYLYIVSVDQFRVSFLDFILILNVKNATIEVIDKWRKVKVYEQVANELDQWFEDASVDELAAVSEDVCVICLKSMDDHAKKLQCGHLFHRLCLRQCLQKTSIGNVLMEPDNRNPERAPALPTTLRCPLCRQCVQTKLHSGEAYSDSPAPAAAQEGEAVHTETPVAPPPATQAPTPTAAPGEEVIRFSTEFISRWIPFPNFSFEIIRHRGPPTPFVVRQEMIHRVWEVFPQYSVEDIHDDLLRTRSPDRTIENILGGRLRRRQTGDDDAVEEDPGFDFADDLNWGLGNLRSSLWNGPPLAVGSPRSSNGDFFQDPNPSDFDSPIPSPPISPRAAPQQEAQVPAIRTESLLRRLQRWRSDGNED